MSIEPINNTAFLLEEAEKVTDSGIILSNASRSGFYVIYAIGENDYDLKPGDKVIASKHVGEEVEIKEKGKPMLLKVCPVDTISAVIND